MNQNETVRSHLLKDGLLGCDITALSMLTAEDYGLRLREQLEVHCLGADNRTLIDAVKAVKDARNSFVHRSLVIGSATTAEYNGLLSRVTGCIDKLIEAGLIDRDWKGRFEAAVTELEGCTEVEMIQCVVLGNLSSASEAHVNVQTKRLRTLTGKQVQIFLKIDEALNRASTQGVLVRAPSGSGKTVLCVKLALRFLLDQLLDADFQSNLVPAPEVDGPVGVVGEIKVMLLLVHSQALLHSIIADVQHDARAMDLHLRYEPGDHYGAHSFRIHTEAGREAGVVSVMTVDMLVTAVTPTETPAGVAQMPLLRPQELAPEHNTLLFDKIVVDEGHWVFSYQCHEHLVGQHTYKDPIEVGRALQKTMRQYCKTIVFHDRSCGSAADSNPQHSGPAPVYPSWCQELLTDLPIVRNPGPVRDVAVPFCRETNEFHPQYVDRVSFVRLLEETLPQGTVLAPMTPTVRFCGTGIAPGMDRGTCYIRYGSALAEELNWIATEASLEWGMVAVLVPGLPVKLRQALLDAALSDANQKNYTSVVEALNNAFGDKDDAVAPDKLYFGPTENFSGLERPFVVTTGFQLPAVVSARSKSAASRVDPCMYIAVTRSTYRLSIVETNAKKYARHFCISGKSDGYVPSSDDGPGAFILPDTPGLHSNIRTARLMKVVDLANVGEVYSAEDLATVVSLAVRRVPALWKDTSFEFRMCPDVKCIHANQCLAENDSPNVLLNDMNLSGLNYLTILELKGNKLTALPRLWDFQSLEQLDLSDNVFQDLTSLDNLKSLRSLNLTGNSIQKIPRIPNLSKLETLILSKNKLTTLETDGCDPPWCVFNLPQLRDLRASENLLVNLPDFLDELPPIESVDLHSNQLETMPLVLCKCVGIQSMNLFGNKLTMLPPQLGNLKQLRELWLGRNNLKKLPNEVGELENLKRLWIQNNNLRKLPKSLNKKLEYLRLDGNEAFTLEAGPFEGLTNISAIKVPTDCGVPESLKHLIAQPARRPRFQLHPRTVPEVPGGMYMTPTRSRIFGDGKPK